MVPDRSAYECSIGVCCDAWAWHPTRSFAVREALGCVKGPDVFWDLGGRHGGACLLLLVRREAPFELRHRWQFTTPFA